MFGTCVTHADTRHIYWQYICALTSTVFPSPADGSTEILDAFEFNRLPGGVPFGYGEYSFDYSLVGVRVSMLRERDRHEWSRRRRSPFAWAVCVIKSARRVKAPRFGCTRCERSLRRRRGVDLAAETLGNLRDGRKNLADGQRNFVAAFVFYAYV